jgi:hypothetical protein
LGLCVLNKTCKNTSLFYFQVLKGQIGDEINVLMAACAWNLRKWMVAVAIFLFWKKVGLFFVKYPGFCCC